MVNRGPTQPNQTHATLRCCCLSLFLPHHPTHSAYKDQTPSNAIYIISAPILFLLIDFNLFVSHPPISHNHVSGTPLPSHRLLFFFCFLYWILNFSCGVVLFSGSIFIFYFFLSCCSRCLFWTIGIYELRYLGIIGVVLWDIIPWKILFFRLWESLKLKERYGCFTCCGVVEIFAVTVGKSSNLILTMVGPS